MSSLPFNEESEAGGKIYWQIKRERWGILGASWLPPLSAFLSRHIHEFDLFEFGLPKKNKTITANKVIYIQMINNNKKSNWNWMDIVLLCWEGIQPDIWPWNFYKKMEFHKFHSKSVHEKCACKFKLTTTQCPFTWWLAWHDEQCFLFRWWHLAR